MKSYFSHGKLLISGEYLVLDGAEAFALPTRYGQHLEIEEIAGEAILDWKAYDHKGKLWFEARFALPSLGVQDSSDKEKAGILQGILLNARRINPEFLAWEQALKAVSKIDFPLDWGLGSSSTLVCNIAKWSETNAFELSESSFGGSGVDIAVGMVGSELIYSVPPAWDSFTYHPGFEDRLFFVHLGRKQNSREAIQAYRRKKASPEQIDTIRALSREIAVCKDFDRFQDLITKHEEVIAGILEAEPVKTRLFSDYPFALKSLGAWGGDFILVCAEKGSERYFKAKGFKDVIPFNEIIKK